MKLTNLADSMGILHLAGISCYSASALYAAKNRRSRDDHDALLVRSRCLPSFVHTELDLQVFLRGTALLRPNCRHCRYRPNDTVLGFLLYLLHKVSS